MILNGILLSYSLESLASQEIMDGEKLKKLIMNNKFVPENRILSNYDLRKQPLQHFWMIMTLLGILFAGWKKIILTLILIRLPFYGIKLPFFLRKLSLRCKKANLSAKIYLYGRKITL